MANSLNFNTTEWYEEMSVKDQDDCGKRMFCELRAKETSGVGLDENERIIADSFGSGNTVDVSKVEVEFDVAAQIGKAMGAGRCAEIYKRCDTDLEDIIAMIRTEIFEIEKIDHDLTKAEMEEMLNEEVEEGEEEIEASIEEELKLKGIDPATVW